MDWNPVRLCVLFAFELWGLRLLAGRRSVNIVSVQIRQGQCQELMLVLPVRLFLSIVNPFGWRRWWVCDLGDEVRCRGFGNPVDQNS